MLRLVFNVQDDLKGEMNMPLVQITIMEGRSDEKKERMIKEVSEAVSNSLDAPMENIRVLINEIPSSHWGIAGQSVAMGRK